MTTEQKLDQELDLIKNMLVVIRKMLEWPVQPGDDHSPLNDATTASGQ